MNECMNVYAALVEWNWQRKMKCLERNLSHWHFVHHKSHMNWNGIEPGHPGWKASHCPAKPWHSPNCPVVSWVPSCYRTCHVSLVHEQLLMILWWSCFSVELFSLYVVVHHCLLKCHLLLAGNFKKQQVLQLMQVKSTWNNEKH
jgi:hypothetical protein